MNTRRQIIRIAPALPLITVVSATALLAACGEKKPAEVAAAAPSPAPAPAAAAPSPAAAPPVAAAPPPPAAAPAAAPAPAAATAAATGPAVDEKDATAVSLGYVADAAKVDKAKYANYVASSNCSSCALYQGAAGSAQGGCPLFAGKQVASKGWCSAWAKKAA
jgi:High potential iron-sulfur protein